MTAEVLSGMAGALLSVLFSYTPGLRTWFDRLGDGPGGQDDGGARKRLVMLALLAAVAGAIFAVSCADLAAGLETVPCNRAGLVELVRILGLAIIANQSIYAISPRPRQPLTPRFRLRRPAPLSSRSGRQ